MTEIKENYCKNINVKTFQWENYIKICSRIQLAATDWVHLVVKRHRRIHRLIHTMRLLANNLLNDNNVYGNNGYRSYIEGATSNAL